MAIYYSRNGNNSNQTAGLAKAEQSSFTGCDCNKANGSDNESQPTNRELERAFKIRMPQRAQRTAAEKLAMVTSEMLEKALSTEQLADYLQIPVKTLRSRIARNQIDDYPECFTLQGSTIRMFPSEWIVEWRQQKTWIHGTVTKVQRFKNNGL
jgi:hypothetical protein